MTKISINNENQFDSIIKLLEVLKALKIRSSQVLCEEIEDEWSGEFAACDGGCGYVENYCECDDWDPEWDEDFDDEEEESSLPEDDDSSE